MQIGFTVCLAPSRLQLTLKYLHSVILIITDGTLRCQAQWLTVRTPVILVSLSNMWHICHHSKFFFSFCQFSVPQIEFPPGGCSKKGSHAYFLLIVAMILLLWHQIVLLWHQVTLVASEYLYRTIVQFNKIVVLPRKLATGNIHDYHFCYCPLVGILFEILRIALIGNLSDHPCCWRTFLK